MRFATLVLALIPAAFAAPIPASTPGLPGAVDAVNDSIQLPDFLVARDKVVKGLVQTRSALQSIIDETAGGDNEAVGAAAQTALDGVEKAQGGVDSIGKAILSGATPERSDQAIVAQGIMDAQAAIGTFNSAVATSSDKLTQDLKSATDGVGLMREGGDGVLAASGLKFEDFGFSVPPAGNGAVQPRAAPAPASGAVPAPPSAPAAKAPVDTTRPVDEAPVDQAPVNKAPVNNAPAPQDPIDEARVDRNPATAGNNNGVEPPVPARRPAALKNRL